MIIIFNLEFVTLGEATAVFSVGAGAMAAYVVVVYVMDFGFRFDWVQSLGAALGSIALTVGLGLGLIGA